MSIKKFLPLLLLLLLCSCSKEQTTKSKIVGEWAFKKIESIVISTGESSLSGTDVRLWEIRKDGTLIQNGRLAFNYTIDKNTMVLEPITTGERTVFTITKLTDKELVVSFDSRDYRIFYYFERL